MSKPALNVGFLLVPDFTLLALAAFVDTLRLAADEGDRSRPHRCTWTLMSDGGRAVRTSSNISVEPTAGLLPPERFDYLVVVGGTLHRGPEIAETTLEYLRTAAARRVPLIGICTGGFVLARAGLMTGRRCCVSWFHRDELAVEFPEMQVVADELYVFDGDRITCAGGTSVVHLASQLVERHVGAGHSAKGLRVMLEERPRSARSPQPSPTIPGLDRIGDARVRRAMLLIESQLSKPLASAEIAAAAGTTVRQLSRLFRREVGLSPGQFREALRLHRARSAVTGSRERIAHVAAEFGFADAAHFSRSYRKHYGVTPTADRRQAAMAGPHSPSGGLNSADAMRY